MIPDRQRLLLRRQFLLAPRYLKEYDCWPDLTLARGLVLHSHPDLPFQQVSGGGRELTLIGFITDPGAPQRNDRQVLESLLAGEDPPGTIPAATENLGGRWVLIVDQPGRQFLFHDACGLRQVYYTRDAEGRVWACSQPGLLQNLPEFGPGIDMYTDHFGNGPVQPDPGNSGPVIRRLLPNHLLDLGTGRTERFWPRERLPRTSLDEGVARAAEIYRNQILAASLRYPLAATLTAGYDSRIALAAARGLTDGILFFVNHTPSHHPGHRDLWVPKVLADDLGLDFRELECMGRMDEEFGHILRKNVPYLVEAYGGASRGHVLYCLLHHEVRDRMTISGVVSELGKGYYHHGKSGIPHPDRLTLRQLQGLNVWWGKKNRVDSDALGAWLKEAEAIEERYGIRLLDLFYWEHLLGRDLAAIHLEFDTVQDRFVPANHRHLIETTLGVDEEFRSGPDYQFHYRVAEYLWPDVVRHPINPVTVRDRVHQAAVSLVTKTGTRGVVNRMLNLQHWIRYR